MQFLDLMADKSNGKEPNIHLHYDLNLKIAFDGQISLLIHFTEEDFRLLEEIAS